MMQALCVCVNTFLAAVMHEIRVDISIGVWSTVAPMNTHRHGVSVAALCGPMYAVGGHDGWSYLSSVERYYYSIIQYMTH